jgi:hypothetical protein
MVSDNQSTRWARVLGHCLQLRLCCFGATTSDWCSGLRLYQV